MKIKISLHNHIDQDPVDNISYSIYDLINEASFLGFKGLSITCHDKFIDPAPYKDFAKNKGVILISGIEKTIQGKHVLILNSSPETEEIRSFQELQEYKQNTPDCFIIAPHPYFYFSTCLGKHLNQNLDLFDAIEFNYFYNKILNPNQKAVKLAEKNQKPLIGTSDTHFLEHLNSTYTVLEINEFSLENILDSLRKNQLEIITKSFSVFQLIKLLFKMRSLGKNKKK